MWDVGLQVHRRRAQVQTPPAAPALPPVIARPAPPTAPTAPGARPGRAYPRHQHLPGPGRLQIHPFDDRVLHTQHRFPYPDSAHAVLPRDRP